VKNVENKKEGNDQQERVHVRRLTKLGSMENMKKIGRENRNTEKGRERRSGMISNSRIILKRLFSL
jgi:uncharacterized protein YciI